MSHCLFKEWFSPPNTSLVILPDRVDHEDIASYLSDVTGKSIEVLRYDSDDNRSSNARITVNNYSQYECDILVGTVFK